MYDVEEPCQPIGCDNGYHLPGCPYIDVDEEPLEITEKMALGIVGIAIIYELVKPERRGIVAKMIDGIVARFPLPEPPQSPEGNGEQHGPEVKCGDPFEGTPHLHWKKT